MTELFFDRLDKIDKVISNGPAICDFSRDVKPYLLEPASKNYLYEKIDDPAWLKVLVYAGQFKDPPSSSIWPQSRYLARMASCIPREVLEIALEVADTENVNIHEDLADAALKMPPKLAVQLVSVAKAWLAYTNLRPFLPEKIGALTSLLAKKGSIDQAIDLAYFLLAVLPVEREGEQVTLTDRPLAELRVRFNMWEYERILNENIPDLVSAAGSRTLTLLCDLLEDALRLSKRDKKIGSEDYSFIWRPAIEEHSQNQPHGIRDILVSAVRDVAEKLIPGEGKKILQILEKRPFKVFKRIGLHLRRKWPQVDPQSTAKLIADAQVYDDVHLHHEFFHLLKEQFSQIPIEAQQTYLDLVERGVGVEREVWISTRKEISGREPSEKEFKDYLRYWQYNKLLPIKQFLDEKWQARFKKLRQEFRDPDHPDFLSYMTSGFVGPASPKSIQELRSMSIKKLVSFMETWEPSDDIMKPSPEGLARELTKLVVSKPEQFAIAVDSFKSLNPIYVSALLSGFRESIKQKSSFPWQPVLELCCQLIMQQTNIIEYKDDMHEGSSGWTELRLEITRLLSDAISSDPPQISFDLRDQLWQVLRPLTGDPNPTSEYEARYGGSNMNPDMISINTVRGEAMHAIMRYALWVNNQLQKESEHKGSVGLGFDKIPEVREALDYHLDPANDPSQAIRSVYGQWLPLLVYLDSKWAIENVSKIFPRDLALRSLYDAAWGTYITFCRLSDQVFDLLRKEYSHAVDKISTTYKETSSLVESEHLAKHLMVFYWHGKLNLKDTEGMFYRFFIGAPDELRSHAIDFVGRSLSGTEQEVPMKILGRLKRFWTWRIKSARSAVISPLGNTELAAFGRWFFSKKFEQNWATKQLKKTLKLSGTIEPDKRVVEHLASLSKDMPDIVLDCLRLIIEGDKKGWHIYTWRDDAKQIITTAIKSKGKTTRQKAIKLINYLGERGLLDFRDLHIKATQLK